MTTKDLRTLERAVALSINFLRALPEDLRVAAIAASADEQPRRAATLDRHAASSRQLASDLGLAWADVAGSPPKASISVDTAVKESCTENRPWRSPRVGESQRELSGGAAAMIAEIDARAKADVGAVNLVERSANDSTQAKVGLPPLFPDTGLPIRFDHRDLPPQHDCIYRSGDINLRLNSDTPEPTRAALFAIADTLGLEGDKHWTIADIVREVREAVSDAAHNDEQGRALVPVAEVCEALGLSPVAREGLAGAEVEIPLDRLMLLTRARGLREALAAAMKSAVEGSRSTVRTIEAVEDGLTRRMAERLAVVDREWLEALMDGAS